MYKQKIDTSKYVFSGRLADYMYYNMHQVFASALHAVKKEINDNI
jgi:UDP-galactopyranose mutase